MGDIETASAQLNKQVRNMDTDEIPDDVEAKVERAGQLLQSAFDDYERMEHFGELD
jgi:hypothetical protein